MQLGAGGPSRHEEVLEAFRWRSSYTRRPVETYLQLPSGLVYYSNHFTNYPKPLFSLMEPLIPEPMLLFISTDAFSVTINLHLKAGRLQLDGGQAVKTMTGGSILHVEGRIKWARAPWLYVLGHLLIFHRCLTNSWGHLFLQLPFLRVSCKAVMSDSSCKLIRLEMPDGKSSRGGNFAKKKNHNVNTQIHAGICRTVTINYNSKSLNSG